jgi:hypothetical protein
MAPPKSPGVGGSTAARLLTPRARAEAPSKAPVKGHEVRRQDEDSFSYIAPLASPFLRRAVEATVLAKLAPEGELVKLHDASENVEILDEAPEHLERAELHVVLGTSDGRGGYSRVDAYLIDRTVYAHAAPFKGEKKGEKPVPTWFQIATLPTFG